MAPDFLTAFGMTALAAFVAAWLMWLLGRPHWEQGVPQAAGAAMLFGFSYLAFAVQTQWVNQELFVLSKVLATGGISAFTLAILRFRQRSGGRRKQMVVVLPIAASLLLAAACLPGFPGWFNQLQSMVMLLQLIYLLINLMGMRANTPGNGWLLVTSAICIQTLAIVSILFAGRASAPEFSFSVSPRAVIAMWVTCLILFLNMMAICVGFLVMLRDRQAAVDHHRSRLDPLTGLTNRRVLVEGLEAIIADANETSRPLALIMVDIDHFKNINDQYGHLAGDRAIQTVARVLSQQSRASDIVSRYGGEEFVLALPDTGREIAEQIAHRLRDQIRQAVVSLDGDVQLQMTASVGVHVVAPAGTTQWQALIAAADSAMYQAKRAGRDRVVSTSGSEMIV